MAKHVFLKAANVAPCLATSNLLTFCIVKRQHHWISFGCGCSKRVD